VQTTGRPIASTVLILNMGTAIELAATRFSKLQTVQSPAYTTVGRAASYNSSSGAVLFTSNICQLEARASDQKAVSSVSIFSFDSVIFSDNQCWVDGPAFTAFLDALLAAGTLQLTGNRLQEGAGFPVIASGLSIGMINIAAQNLSTYCLFNHGALKLIDVNNVAIIGLSNEKFCPEMAGQLHL
jgi:hypothetical protein